MGNMCAPPTPSEMAGMMRLPTPAHSRFISNSNQGFAPRGARRPRICWKLPPPKARGRTGMPGAQCTHSLVCEG